MSGWWKYSYQYIEKTWYNEKCEEQQRTKAQNFKQRTWCQNFAKTIKEWSSYNSNCGCVAVKNFCLVKKWLKWCKIFKTWSIDNWSKVLFTDESSFELFSTKQCIVVRRRPNEKYRLQCEAPTMKHGGSAIMLWAPYVRKELDLSFSVTGLLMLPSISTSWRKLWRREILIISFQMAYFTFKMTTHLFIPHV